MDSHTFQVPPSHTPQKMGKPLHHLLITFFQKQGEDMVLGTFPAVLQQGRHKPESFLIFERISHLNRNQIESNLSVPGIQGCHENALYKSFEMSPHFISLCSSTNIP